ncbi:hypothetical protein D3C81_1178830 [compost metagenome]
MPRAGNRRGRGRFRRRHEPPARAGTRRRQVQDGRRPGVRGRQDRVPWLRKAGVAAGVGHRAVCGRRGGRHHAGRPDRRGGAGQHAVLRRVGRPGRRPGRAEGRQCCICCRRHHQGPGRRVRPPGHAGRRRAEGGRCRVGAGRRAAPCAHRAQPLGHPPDAQGPARSAGHARAAEGLAGGCGQDPLRLLAQRRADRRPDPPGGRARQCRDPAQRRYARRDHAVRRRGQERRDGAVRREVRRRRARAVDRHLEGTVRRHPRAPHRRHRPVQDRGGGRRRCRHPPRGSDHRRQRAALPAEPRCQAERSRCRAEGAAVRAGAAYRPGAGAGACAGEGAGAPEEQAGGVAGR